MTQFFSKVFEQYVVTWLLDFVTDKLEWGQYGGMKGISLTHHLVDFVNYILFDQDLRVPHAVLSAMVDFSKAFKRISHNILIANLSKMGVPGWLLGIVIGFLLKQG